MKSDQRRLEKTSDSNASNEDEDFLLGMAGVLLQHNHESLMTYKYTMFKEQWKVLTNPKVMTSHPTHMTGR